VQSIGRAISRISGELGEGVMLMGRVEREKPARYLAHAEEECEEEYLHAGVCAAFGCAATDWTLRTIASRSTMLMHSRLYGQVRFQQGAQNSPLGISFTPRSKGSISVQLLKPNQTEKKQPNESPVITNRTVYIAESGGLSVVG
jgi:hypothetical protein